MTDTTVTVNGQSAGPTHQGGFYRFSYNGSEKAYVGVMAQEVQTVMPDAVTRGSDGYLRVYYQKIGVKFQTYDQWIAAGGQIPASTIRH